MCIFLDTFGALMKLFGVLGYSFWGLILPFYENLLLAIDFAEISFFLRILAFDMDSLFEMMEYNIYKVIV